MKNESELIRKFNKNKSKDSYREILNERFPDNYKCRICSDIIYYYDSTFTIKDKEIQPKGKSFLSTKNLDRIYYLSACEDCLTKKYPEYSDKNKSRVFNQMSHITEYAFDINHETALKWMKENYAITEENLIKKWGDELGREKWIEYCNKQALSNKFEYKNEKYGWTREQFKEYNMSRSVTIENLTRRHGEEKGLEIWKDYCNKQQYTTTLEYFIEKHGEEKGTEIYDNFCKKRLSGIPYSKISIDLFEYLIPKINKKNKYRIYYKDNEWYSYDNSQKKYYLIDFYIRELNIGIEFNGDVWHANPKKYKPEDKPFPFQKELNAQDIWDKDRDKNDFLRTKLKKLIIIWESDLYMDGFDKTVDKILKEIYE